MEKNIVCFGEILWDIFPKYKKIGGAPLNGAFRLKSLGNEVSIISSIGKDKNGEELVNFITNAGISTLGLQESETYITGEVNVMLNEKGSASYDIQFPRAWDFIELNDQLKDKVKAADAFIYGSLVARNQVSKSTLLELLTYAKFSVFDVNLRPPYYTIDLILELMNKADFVKFNDDELFEISKALGSKYNSIEQNVKYIAETTNTKKICVTKGKHGALILFDGVIHYNSGFLINVVDTVGAGDSFLASLIDQILKGKSPQEAINFACAVGALVAQSEGANPKLTMSEIQHFLNPYQ